MDTVNISPKGDRAKIEAAAAEVERTHLAVADAAAAWVAAGYPRPADDEPEGAELHDAVVAWKRAGEALIVAMRGGT